jgi:hypothetical protein
MHYRPGQDPPLLAASAQGGRDFQEIKHRPASIREIGTAGSGWL